MIAVCRTLLAALFLAATGCRTLPTAIPLPSDDPRPHSLMGEASERARARRGLRAVARLAVDSERRGVHVRGKLALVVERPSRLRVEVLGLLGQTVGVLVTDGDRYEWFESGDRSYRRGVVYPDLLWDVVSVPLAAAEVVDLVLGEATPGRGLVVGGASERGDGWIEVHLVDARGVVRERIAFDPEARLRRVEVLPHPGVNARRADFDRYQVQDGVAFASEISVEFPDLEVRAELSLRDVELNPPLSPELFRLRVSGMDPPAAREGE